MALDRKQIHIISFDIPYPANYGGVIDVLEKIKALSKEGILIYLHCFQYNRNPSRELEKYCKKVHYYKRKSIFRSLGSFQPTIVGTRMNKELLANLLKDELPILFEGLHTCAFLAHPKLANRVKLVRMHNVEHRYYEGLSQSNVSLWKKIYLKWEAYRLKNFESILTHASAVLAISNTESAYFKRYNPNTHYLPAFHSNPVETVVEHEDFALYHGNLQVEENEEAAEYLLKVFEHFPFSLTVAGRNPCKRLRKKIASLSNVKLIVNPTDEELKTLLKKAKVNCLPTFQSTGVKLKLIQSLIMGNEVLVNNQMIEGTGLEPFCIRANGEEEWREKLKNISEDDLVPSAIIQRRQKVASLFNNADSVIRLEEWFFQAR